MPNDYYKRAILQDNLDFDEMFLDEEFLNPSIN